MGWDWELLLTDDKVLSMQCKDILDRPILELLDRISRENPDPIEVRQEMIDGVMTPVIVHGLTRGLFRKANWFGSEAQHEWTKHGVASEWNKGEPIIGRSHSVLEAMPDGTDPKLALSKMRKLMKRGLVSGCGCGCRGDFEITEKGQEWLKSGDV